LVSFKMTREKAMGITNGLITADLRDGGIITNSMVLEFISLLKRQKLSTEYGKWGRGLSFYRDKNAKVSEKVVSITVRFILLNIWTKATKIVSSREQTSLLSTVLRKTKELRC
jgi:hypothetical protein